MHRTLLALLALLAIPASASAGPLRTAIVDDVSFASAAAPLAFDRAGAAGATFVELTLNWRSLAPGGARKPDGFDAGNPADPAYADRWEAFDQELRLATERRLQPIVTILQAPTWATGAGNGRAGLVRPDPAELGLFALAAAKRYNGSFQGLPRVRHWRVWNEPNISLFLVPQFVDGRPFSPGLYRSMVNAVAGAVKSVRADNLVVAGGTAPFRDITPEVEKVDKRWGPLSFMRELLCLSKALTPKCKQRVRFDIWSHHPYTSGGPTHNAVLPDDVSLGDLPEMRRVLMAGARSGNIVSRGRVDFWVTEFSWDSSPPDPRGVPARLEARWTSEALYRMWRSGVSLVTWFLLRDEPLATSPYQSGLFYRGATLERDRAKPARQAFRFPVVALPDSRGVLVWGRTPSGVRGAVIVEQSFKGGWKRLGLLRTDGYGIFQRRYSTSRVGSVRARLTTTGESSVPFGVPPVADRFFHPFGQTLDLEP
ncbi:MAG TPA: hypothetical protein VNI55_08930 [Gaiellaceae bacterium]|nr:hypothetical protein [Gaiellaceae bacterium]